MFLPYFSLWGSGVSPLWPEMMGDGSQTSIALGHVALESVGFVPLGFLCKSQTFFFFWMRLLHGHPRAIMGTVRVNDS